MTNRKTRRLRRAVGSSVPRWQQVENVVAALERALGTAPGWRIRQNAMVTQKHGDRRRQVDVYVECPSGPRVFSIAIDVKDTVTPLDIESVEQLCAKAAKLVVDRYILVSTGGFTEQARDEAARHGVSAMDLRLLDFSEFFALDSFTQLITESSDVVLLYEDPAEAPSSCDLETARLVVDGKPYGLRHLAGQYARIEFERDPSVPKGIARILEVRDTERRWTTLQCEGVSAKPPSAMRITWTPQVVQLEGRKFRSADGVEVFTAVLPRAAKMQQVSVIASPHPDGGKQISVTVSDARPGRVHV